MFCSWLSWHKYSLVLCTCSAATVNFFVLSLITPYHKSKQLESFIIIISSWKYSRNCTLVLDTSASGWRREASWAVEERQGHVHAPASQEGPSSGFLRNLQRSLSPLTAGAVLAALRVRVIIWSKIPCEDLAANFKWARQRCIVTAYLQWTVCTTVSLSNNT